MCLQREYQPYIVFVESGLRPEVGRYKYLFTKNLQIIFLQFDAVHIKDLFLHVAGMRFGNSFG